MFLLYLLIPAALATVDFNATEVFHDDIPDNQDGAPSALPKKLFSFSPPFAPIDSSNEACRNESLTYLTNLYRFDLNAVMMYDATAKLPSGLLRGNVNQFGDFDLCLSAEGKYCLTYIDLKLAGTDFHALTEAHTLIHSHHAFRGTVKDPGHRVPRFSSIHWAVCVPKSCSNTDVEDSMSKVADDLSSGTGLKASVKVFPEMCQVASTEQVATSAWVVGTLFLVIIGFCFLATGADFFKLEETSIGMDLLICFSLKKNCKKLFSTEVAPDDISSVHGIRFLNAIMLYISHKSMALFYNPYMNRTIMAEALGKPWTVVARAASLYTDPFIMMSGLLTSHSLGKQYQRTKKIDVPREFLSRFMRLLPTLGALILFCTFILPYLGSGPQWPLVIEHHATLCKQYWWRNMLLIHNYFGFQNMCLTHTHHIGIDTQLFLVSPLLIYIVNKWPKQGLLTLLIIGVLSTLLRLYAVYYRQLNLYVYFGNSISQMFDTADYSYILPTHRATVYVMGIALGYVLRQWGRDVKLKNSQLALGWMLAICSLYQCVVQPSKMGDRFYVYDTTDAVMYAGFAPITWCLVFSWVIFTTHTGNGGSYPVAPCLWCVGVGGSPAGGWLWAGAGGSFRQNPPNRPHSSAEQRQSHSRQIHTAKLRVDAARMWVSQTLLSLLLLMATSEGYYSELYPMPVGFMANDDTVSIPVREPKSGIFWTGRRYSRRGSSEETKKKVKTRAESRFVIGSRYGKRTDVVPLDFGSNLCKFTSFHPLYPCSNR